MNRWRSLILTVLTLLSTVASAQESTVIATRGKRFWTGFMQNGFGAQSLKVHILSRSATSGTVSLPLNGWTTNFTVSANNVTVIDVPTIAENSGSGNILPKGVLIQSTDSINVFISSFQNFTHDASQVLPESSLGNTYRVDAYQGLPNFNNLHKSEFLVVATQDGTQIRITPSVNTLSGQSANVPFIVDLNAGQSYQIQAATDQLDLTGTLVEATVESGTCRPFVVLGGSMCATVPGACQACDAIFEQLVPITAWGTRYYTAPLHGVNTSTYRVLAHTNGTSISINGGPPILLNAGERHEANGTTSPVCIQSNLPVSVVQLLEGYSCAGSGDPSLLLVSPADRLSQSASWNTSNSSQVGQHSVSVVVPIAAIGQLTLDGTVVNPSLFQPYPSCTDRKYAKIPVTAGRHRLSAAAGFQAYMIGTGYGESYAASVHDIGAISVQQDSVICGLGPVTLNAPEPLADPTWTKVGSPAVLATGSSYTFTPTESGSYVITGTSPLSGCTRTFTYHVGTPLTIPTLLTANDQPQLDICQYGTAQLALVPPPDPAWFDIQWSPAFSLDNDTIYNPIATPMTSTWYRVQVTSPSGCGNMIDSIRVNVTPATVLDLGTSATPAAVCQGSPVQLGSVVLRVLATDRFNGPAGSMWTAIQGGTVSATCGSQSGTALYFNGNGQRYAQTVSFNTNGGGELRFRLKIANGQAPCDNAEPGDDVVLEYSNNNGLNWSLLQTFDQNDFPGFEPREVAIPAPAQTAATMFRLRQLANDGAGQDNWAIDDVIVAKFDNNWVNYAWSQPSTLNNAQIPAPVATPTASGWYVLNATEPNSNCAYQDSVFIQVDPAFSINVTPSTTICTAIGTPITATPSSGSNITYAWTPNNGTLSNANVQSPTATPTSTTTYSVTATTPIGCSASGQVTITVGQLQSLTLSAANTTLCQGQSTQLNAVGVSSGDLSYAWTGNGLSNPAIPDPIVSPTQTTTYTCTVTQVATGCTLSQSITINMNTGYTADLGPDLSLCSTLGHQLTVQHNVPNPTYLWTPAANLNSATIASPTILSDVTATYTVTISDANGCSVSDQVVITRPFLGVPATQTASGCVNSAPTLTAPVSASSYLWNTGAVTASIVPTISGPHTVTMTNAQGCTVSTTFNVALFPLPVVDLGADISLCGVSSQSINAGNPGSTFAWSTNATTQEITATSSGTFSVNVTNANGCVASDAVHIALNALPVDNLSDITACAATTVTLNAGNPGSTYAWTGGATTQSITPTASGIYSVTVTTPENCSSEFSADVTILPEVTVDLGNDTTLCEGATLTLDAGNAGVNFLWSTGATTPTISTNASGIYSVTVDNGACNATDDVEVTLRTAPIDVLMDQTHCVGGTALLDAGNIGCTFLWSTGATTPTISAQTPGTFSVVITNDAGCSNTFDATVTFVQPPSVQLGVDTTLCEGQALVLDAGNPGSTFAWSNGSTARTLTVRQPGTYAVQVDNGSCSRSDAITVQFNPSPARLAARQFHACLGEDEEYVRIDAGNPGSQYDWSTGETSRVILAGAYGWYAVEVLNQFDCAARDSAEVVEFCPSAIFIPNTFTPNGDGTNDYFLPVGKNIAAMHMYVFDRWGNQLFESDDSTMGWDGTYGGQVVKNDIYVWRLTYKFTEDKDGSLGTEHQQMGHIQVLR
ncbi:MAG: gliding motility-associated C-terminal domain-containing protein [Flavobacteriales bacterium]|nr:gliding motility-associated C-terminal domain-containing protein [Flavobacteriales bacterium]MBK6883364.1 gliding motility-associated C-terminal domain-containing protein [Flavobacteriales bacterium]MBK7103009.1 gliding motility-associated C-terminal domain-containing protein [Flavobacteriales bacterium]MBK7113890.1 gliding motility-associated C-terminal domain-containing protein [Flavobacteriales bacterium]MBK8531203.1 gliding motility-associated C-terminal domain-containing protein [Flavob